MPVTYMTRKDAEVGEGEFDSIAWIFEVHIKQPDTKRYHYALVSGNEDCPTKIELWESEPDWNTPPDFVWEPERESVK